MNPPQSSEQRGLSRQEKDIEVAKSLTALEQAVTHNTERIVHNTELIKTLKEDREKADKELNQEIGNLSNKVYDLEKFRNRIVGVFIFVSSTATAILLWLKHLAPSR